MMNKRCATCAEHIKELEDEFNVEILGIEKCEVCDSAGNVLFEIDPNTMQEVGKREEVDNKNKRLRIIGVDYAKTD